MNTDRPTKDEPQSAGMVMAEAAPVGGHLIYIPPYHFYPPRYHWKVPGALFILWWNSCLRNWENLVFNIGGRGNDIDERYNWAHSCNQRRRMIPHIIREDSKYSIHNRSSIFNLYFHKHGTFLYLVDIIIYIYIYCMCVWCEQTLSWGRVSHHNPLEVVVAVEALRSPDSRRTPLLFSSSSSSLFDG